jgi:hypothetical protein
MHRRTRTAESHTRSYSSTGQSPPSLLLVSPLALLRTRLWLQTRSNNNTETRIPFYHTRRAPSSSPTELMMLHTSGLPQFAQVAECSKVRPRPCAVSHPLYLSRERRLIPTTPRLAGHRGQGRSRRFHGRDHQLQVARLDPLSLSYIYTLNTQPSGGHRTRSQCAK